MKLTNKSRIAIRWTSAPSDLGYGGKETGWMKSTPIMRSPRTALEFEHELTRELGQGVCKRISYQHRGVEIGIEDIREVVYSA